MNVAGGSEIQLKDYLTLVYKYRYLAIAITGLSILIALTVSWLTEPIYESKAQLIVHDRIGESDDRASRDIYQDMLASERLALTYSRMATRASLLRKVSERADLPDGIRGVVRAEPIRDTQLIVITAQDPDPETAALVANTVGEFLASEAQELDEATYSSQGSDAVRISLIEPATPSESPIVPKPIANLMLGLFVGLGLSLLIVFLTDHLDTTIKDASDLQSVIGTLPVLAQIPKSEGRAERLLTKRADNSVSAEAFRALRTNLIYLNYEGGLKTVMVASSKPDEGKTTVNANLGATLAQAGNRVLVLGADLRRPRLQEALSVNPTSGLTDVLIGAVTPEDAICPTTISGLFVLAAGSIPPNPADLIGSKRMTQLLEQVRKDFDYVLIDTPPILAVTDAMILAQQVDGVILVARSAITERESVELILRELGQANIRVAGAVLNGIESTTEYGYYSDNQKQASSNKMPKRVELSVGSAVLMGVGATVLGFTLVSMLGPLVS